jgi:hypothetical protein
MKEIKVSSEKRREFVLSINDKAIGKLTIKKWSVVNGEIMLSDGETYQIQSKSWWRTQVDVKQREKIALTYKMNWKGHILITALFRRTPAEFVFRRQGIFKGTYILLDNTGQQLATVEPNFKWSKFRTEYTIKVSRDIFRDDEGHDTLFYFVMAHCANYLMAMGAAHAAHG